MQLPLGLFSEPADLPSPVSCAIGEALTESDGDDARGAVYTRREVVDFVLDLVGYTPDRPLGQSRLLEPSAGAGDFLLPAIDRLLAAWRAFSPNASLLDDLGEAIRAVELHHDTFLEVRRAVVERLKYEGITPQIAETLADRWLIQGDFLLVPLGGHFDFIIGNPPYVRQELIPARLLAVYRSRYQTIYDRADLYIPFIERSLSMLADRGNLGFICADRWMKNRYGGPLRRLVADHFHLKFYVDMANMPAFHRDVIAYPAVTVITREPPGATRIAQCASLARDSLAVLARELRGESPLAEGNSVRELAHIVNGAEPWLLGSAGQVALIRRLEQQFRTIEEEGCQVGIGVATGADKAFIGHFDSLDVEPDRKLPLVTTRDILSGRVRWRGLGVINPFTDDGQLVDLGSYPLLRRYLQANREVIAGRHCAKKNPSHWYRTIDRITPQLAQVPKLLIPDIKGKPHVVFERGELYPHHNLYYVTSRVWDLRALQAVLLSNLTHLFIATYSTKMQGGYMRFQAQYLRRIRIPAWGGVPSALRMELAAAAESQDIGACNRAVARLYDLSEQERSLLGETE